MRRQPMAKEVLVKLQIRPIPLLTDNYAWALMALGGPRGERPAVVVDPSAAAPVARQLAAWRARLVGIWLTHHHPDHIGGVEGLRAAGPSVQVTGHRADQARLPALDEPVVDGGHCCALGARAEVLRTDGHTIGAICYHLPAHKALFTGDTLFTGGCGRLFEGSAAQMLASLARLAQLPADTQVFCGHEYTVHNARFAVELMPTDPSLVEHLARCEAAAAAGQPMVPQSLAAERRHNLFLRCDQVELRRRLGTMDAVGTLQRLRALRDQF